MQFWQQIAWACGLRTIKQGYHHIFRQNNQCFFFSKREFPNSKIGRINGTCNYLVKTRMMLILKHYCY